MFGYRSGSELVVRYEMKSLDFFLCVYNRSIAHLNIQSHKHLIAAAVVFTGASS